MKLKDLLKESTTRYKSMGESDEEEKGMTNAEKREFLKGVSEYKKFGESIYRTGDLAEVYESIKGIVETAHKVTLQETGDWFDKVTVGRHMKSMNESFKVFSSTIREVNSLQQRLESCYDEMGEVLGKYYEIKEGNEFGAERANAIAKGDDEFEVDGKKFPVTDVDKEDKENAKKFAKESVLNESLGLAKNNIEKIKTQLSKILGSDVVVKKDNEGSRVSHTFSVRGGKYGIYIDEAYDGVWNVYTVRENGFPDKGDAELDDESDAIKELLRLAKKYKKSLTTESNSMKLTDILSENKYTIIDPKGNTAGTGTKDQANKRQKQLGGDKKGYFVVPAKSALKARRALEKYKHDFKNAKLRDYMSGLYFDDEMFGESVINEAGFATWEMSFANMNLSGVKLDKKNVYKVKARNTVEAIKKAAKMAGVKDGDWVATQTHSLKKIG
jgi:hypothetical protein